MSSVGVLRPLGAGSGGTSYSLGTRCKVDFVLPVTEKIVPVNTHIQKSQSGKTSMNQAESTSNSIFKTTNNKTVFKYDTCY